MPNFILCLFLLFAIPLKQLIASATFVSKDERFDAKLGAQNELCITDNAMSQKWNLTGSNVNKIIFAEHPFSGSVAAIDEASHTAYLLNFNEYNPKSNEIEFKMMQNDRAVAPITFIPWNNYLLVSYSNGMFRIYDAEGWILEEYQYTWPPSQTVITFYYPYLLQKEKDHFRIVRIDKKNDPIEAIRIQGDEDMLCAISDKYLAKFLKGKIYIYNFDLENEFSFNAIDELSHLASPLLAYFLDSHLLYVEAEDGFTYILDILKLRMIRSERKKHITFLLEAKSKEAFKLQNPTSSPLYQKRMRAKKSKLSAWLETLEEEFQSLFLD